MTTRSGARYKRAEVTISDPAAERTEDVAGVAAGRMLTEGAGVADLVRLLLEDRQKREDSSRGEHDGRNSRDNRLSNSLPCCGA